MAAYLPLQKFFPSLNRRTLERWRKEGKIRPPDEIVSGRAYWLDDRSPLSESAKAEAKSAKPAARRGATAPRATA